MERRRDMSLSDRPKSAVPPEAAIHTGGPEISFTTRGSAQSIESLTSAARQRIIMYHDVLREAADMDSMDGRGRTNSTGGTAQQHHRPVAFENRAQPAHGRMDGEMLADTSAAAAEAPPLVRKLSKSKAAQTRRGSGAHLSVKTGQSNITDATEKMTRNLSSITTLDTEDGGDDGFGDDVLAREIMNLRQNSDKSLDFDANAVFDEEEDEDEEESEANEYHMPTDQHVSNLHHQSQSSFNSSSSSSQLQSHGITLTDAQRRLIVARYQREKALGRNTSSARSIAMAAAAASTGNPSKSATTTTVTSIQQGLQQKGKSRRASSDRPTVAELRQQGKMPSSRMRSQSDANVSGKSRGPNAKNALRKYSYQEDMPPIVQQSENHPQELCKRDSDEELAEVFADKISTDGDYNYEDAEDAQDLIPPGGGTVSTQTETVELSKEDDATVKQSSRSSSASPSRNLIDSPRVSVTRRAGQDTATIERTVDSVSHQATQREVNVAAARIYVGTGISTDISVASSITESHAIVPGSLDVLTTASSIARGHHPSTNKNRKTRRSSEHSGSEEESINRARVASWLSKQCLERYTDKFIEEGYDSLDRVRYIDKSKLERMEILPGHRRSLYHAILALRRQRPQTNLELISEESLSENPSEEQPTVESSTVDAPLSSHGSGVNSGSNTSGNQLQGQQHRRSQVAAASAKPKRAAPRMATSSQRIAQPNSRRNLNSARHALRQDQDRIQRKISSLKSNRRIGAGTGMNSTTTKKGQMIKREVRFSVAEVRTYERYYSDNPSVTAGPPVGIGWRHIPRLTVRFSAVAHSHARDERNVPTGFCPVLNRDQREQCLEDAGFSSKDIAAATRMAIKGKNERRQTVQNLEMGPTSEVEEVLESIGRSIKKIVRPGRRK